MPYTPEKPALPWTSEELRARIPGWGVDLDPADRPSYPRENRGLELTGNHGEHPAQQPERWPRERSVEHLRLTPVFGTSCPPKGLSGAVRKLAYRRYSEGRAAHWLLLMAGDRIDALESTLRSLATLHPDNPVTQTGVLSERRRHGVRSRRGRVDVRHQWLDPIIVGAPWVAGAAVVFRVGRRAVARASRHD